MSLSEESEMSKQRDHNGSPCRKTHPAKNHVQFLRDEHDRVIADCDVYHPDSKHADYRNGPGYISIHFPGPWGDGVTELEEVYVQHSYQLGVLLHHSLFTLFSEDSDNYLKSNEYARVPNPFTWWEGPNSYEEEKQWEWSMQEIQYAERVPNGSQLHPRNKKSAWESDLDASWHLITDKLRSDNYVASRKSSFLVDRKYESSDVHETLENSWAGNQISFGGGDPQFAAEALEKFRKTAHEAMILTLQDSLVTQLSALRSSFISSLASTLMRNSPHLIPSDVSFRWGELRDVPDHDELIDIAIRKHMNSKFLRNGLTGELAWLKSVSNDELSIDDHTMGRIRETAELRNAIAHSSSKVTSSTQIRVPWLDLEEGSRIEIPANMLRCLIRSHVNFFSQVAMIVSQTFETKFMSDFLTVSCDCDDSYSPQITGQ